MHSDFTTARQQATAEPAPAPDTSRKLPGWVLPLRLQTSYPDIVIIDIRADAVSKRQGKRLPRRTRGTYTINIIEIKYKYDLEIHSVVPSALAQHDDLKRNLLDFGWKAVHVHAFIIGSAGTISQSLHTTLTHCGLPALETRQRLLNRIAADSVVRTARIVQLRGLHKPPTGIQPPARDGTTGLTPPGTDTHPATDPRNPSQNQSQATSTPPSVLQDSPASPPISPVPDRPAVTLHTPNDCHDPGESTDHTVPLRRSARKRTPSVLLQDQSDISPPLTRRRTAVHTPQDDAHLGSAPPQATPSRQHKSADPEQPLPASPQAENTLLTSDRAVQSPPPITLIPCTAAQNNPPPGAAVTPSTALELTDTQCLPSQAAISPSRHRRTCGPPARLRASPARGRDRQRTPPTASQRPKHDRRAPSRHSPPPQSVKRPRLAKDPSPPVPPPRVDTQCCSQRQNSAHCSSQAFPLTGVRVRFRD